MDSPIYAIADGVVDYVGPGKAGRPSLIIILKCEFDGRSVYGWYKHMYRDGLFVRQGQEVSAGDVLAGVASNDTSTGPHLHLAIHADDQLTTTEPLAWPAEHGAVDVSKL